MVAERRCHAHQEHTVLNNSSSRLRAQTDTNGTMLARGLRDSPRRLAMAQPGAAVAAGVHPPPGWLATPAVRPHVMYRLYWKGALKRDPVLKGRLVIAGLVFRRMLVLIAA